MKRADDVRLQEGGWPVDRAIDVGLGREMKDAIDGVAAKNLNMETLVTCPVTQPFWEDQLRALVERHAAETGSARAAEILQDWDRTRAAFLQVCPVEMLAHLKHPLADAGELAAVPAE